MYTAWWRTGQKGGFAAVSTGELPVSTMKGTTLFMERAISMDDYDGDDFLCTLKRWRYAARIPGSTAPLPHLRFSPQKALCAYDKKPPLCPLGSSDAYVRRTVRHHGR